MRLDYTNSARFEDLFDIPGGWHWRLWSILFVRLCWGKEESLPKGLFTLYRGDVRPGASPLRFPLMTLYLFMIPRENVITERVITVRVHHGFCTGARISFLYADSKKHHVNKEQPLVSVSNILRSGLERVAPRGWGGEGNPHVFVKISCRTCWLINSTAREGRKIVLHVLTKSVCYALSEHLFAVIPKQQFQMTKFKVGLWRVIFGDFWNITIFPKFFSKTMLFSYILITMGLCRIINPTTVRQHAS